jgi:hypothetical protein
MINHRNTPIQAPCGHAVPNHQRSDHAAGLRGWLRAGPPTAVAAALLAVTPASGADPTESKATEKLSFALKAAPDIREMADGRTVIVLDDGRRFVVPPESTIRIRQADGDTRLAVDLDGGPVDEAGVDGSETASTANAADGKATPTASATNAPAQDDDDADGDAAVDDGAGDGNGDNGNAESDQSIGEKQDEDATREAALEQRGFGIVNQGDLTIVDSLSYSIDETSPRGDERRALRNRVSVSYGVFDRWEAQAAVQGGYVESEPGPRETDESKDTGASLGDVTLGVNYDLFSEEEVRPEVTLSPRLTIPTKDRADLDRTDLSSGFYRIGLTANFSKNFDALTVFGNLGATHTFEADLPEGSQDPGATGSLGFGTAFTVNRDITLTNNWNFSHTFARERDGEEIRFSEQDSATVSFGATWALTETLFMRPDVTIGLKDSADGRLGLSLIYSQ